MKNIKNIKNKKIYPYIRKKDDRIDILINKDLKDSIKQVACNNGYNLSHYLNLMIMNEVFSSREVIHKLYEKVINRNNFEKYLKEKGVTIK